jgi:hypothetical protein
MLLVVLHIGGETPSDLLIGVEVSPNNFLFFILIAVVGLDTCSSCVDLIFILKDWSVGSGVYPVDQSLFLFWKIEVYVQKFVSFKPSPF